MDPLQFLSQFPQHNAFSRKSRILLFAYYLRKHRGMPEFGPREIRECFHGAMLRVPGDLTAILKSQSRGRDSPIIKARTKGRYSLSMHGLNEVEGILPPSPEPQEGPSIFLSAALPYLKRTISKVQEPARREFLAEAVSCLGVEARRATIIMTWLATLDHVYQYVLKHKLSDFRTALTKRTDKVSTLAINGQDDFGEMKEAVFIEVCRSAKIISHDVRKILDEKLGIRNSCAHPSNLTVSDSKVVGFIEDLVENVIAKYEL